MPSLSLVGVIALVLNLASVTLADCESYGIDFQNGGMYFQNKLSNDTFTALQLFEGCDNDIAYNILVNPDGDQTQCTETPLQPDDAPMLVNCTDTIKSSMESGDWSIVIISNNGMQDPIAYQRDFYIAVGNQETSTYTPTLTFSSVTTPIFNSTMTQTSVATITRVNQITQRASTSTLTTTRALLTWTQWTWTKTIKSSLKTVSAKCVIPKSTPMLDILAQIQPTILGSSLNSIAASVISSAAEDTATATTTTATTTPFGAAPIAATPIADLSGSAKFKREVLQGRTPNEYLRKLFVAERHQRLHAHHEGAIVKRAPDAPTIILTATTNLFSTTQISTAPTVTATFITEVTSSATINVFNTITLKPVTVVRTKLIGLQAVTRTLTLTTTIINTVTTTGAYALASCAKRGGVLV